MLIDGVYDTDIVQPPRNEKLMMTVKPLVNFVVRSIADVHVNMPKETWEFMYEYYGVMIPSRHVGLTETGASPVTFYRLRLPVPYPVIGDNLVKGDRIVSFLKQLGLIFSERTNADIYSAVIDSRSKIASVIKSGNNVALYPTQGRSKNGLTVSFQSSPFQVAILLDVPIIPQSPGYFTYPEENHFIGTVHRKKNAKVKGYTVKWYDLPSLLFSHKGDLYLNYGQPIIPSEFFKGQVPANQIAEKSKILADHVRKECLYLTPITERNIVAYAMEKEGILRYNVADTLEKLQSFAHRFTFKFPGDCNLAVSSEISLDDKVDILIRTADLKGKHQKLVQMYGNEIKHYVEGMYGRKFD